VRRQSLRFKSHCVAVDGEVAAGGAAAGSDRTLRAQHRRGQCHGDVDVLDLVVPGRCDDIPEEHRGRVRVTRRVAELLTCADGSGIEHAGDGVPDLEHVRPRGQGAVRATDLGHPEPFPALPEQLVGRRFAVPQDRLELRHLPDLGTVLVGDIPVPEDAVPSDGELTGDGLHGSQITVGVHRVVGGVVTDDHRIGGAVATSTGGRAENQRPQHAKRDEHQRDQ
jgi:hypothetical protein